MAESNENMELILTKEGAQILGVPENWLRYHWARFGGRDPSAFKDHITRIFLPTTPMARAFLISFWLLPSE
jgi:hypothetical protein